MNLSAAKLFLLAVLIYIISFPIYGQVPSFTLPDTVCINSPVKITNTSVGGSSYYWNFCVADINTNPEATNLGNIGGLLSLPVFIDIVSENGKYYGFVTNYSPGRLVRLDFGNNMLNTPTAVNLGDFGGILPLGTEGIQVIKNNGKWYAIIVAGGAESGSSPRIVRIEIGVDITNSSPIATNWGNLGNLEQPIDFFLIKENNNWHGFTVNSGNNTVTVFDFGSGFDNPPNAINLGNTGNFLNYPTGICAINDAGFWHLYITSAYNSSLIRLDFGNSLLNLPVVTNLGNPGNTLSIPRDITVLQFCNQLIGFTTNFTNDNLVKLNFNNDLLSIPTATDLGNIGKFSFPHSLSKLFRVGADLYSFIPNAHNNTLSRVKFSGCTNSSISNYTAPDPPPIIYSQPGVYNVNLLMDEGLSTQASICKTITVLAPPDKVPPADSSSCTDTLILRSRFITPNLWSDGSLKDSLIIKKSGVYWVNTAYYGCKGRDSFNCRIIAPPVVKSITDTAICKGSSILLTTLAQNMDSVKWTPASGLSNPAILSPVAHPPANMNYIITAYHEKCGVSDTVVLTLKDTPVITVNTDTLICTGGTARLFVSGIDPYHYSWFPSGGLSDSHVADPLATPSASGYYYVTATGGNACTTLDSVRVKVKPPDSFTVDPSPANLCKGDTLLLKVGGGFPESRNVYQWLTPVGQQDPSLPYMEVFPSGSTVYQVIGFDEICNTQNTLSATVNVLSKPSIIVSKSNDIDCIQGEARLFASGGIDYSWNPAGTLSDSLIASPVASVDTTTLYYVVVTGANGCFSKDSIRVIVNKNSTTNGYPVANAFTPNGDGHNDCFGIKYWGYIDHLEISVFNRWGQRVFSSQNRGQCWDGTFNGHMQPAGTYAYIIKARTLCGDVIRKGTLLLIR